MYAADIVSDVTGRSEIITVGSVYNGPLAGTQAQLKLSSWTGSTLTLEHTEEWSLNQDTTTIAYSVFADDVDDDATTEIVVVGYGQSQGGSPHPQLTIWSWDGSDFDLELDLSRVSAGIFRSVYAYDFDSDDIMEIAVVGEDGNDGALWVFNWDGSDADLMDEETWSGTEVRARSVYIENVGSTWGWTILTAGYTKSGTAYSGQVRAYQYSGGTLSYNSQAYWQYSSSSTEGFSVTATEFHSGNGVYIAACGRYSYSGTWNSWVRIWRIYNGAFDFRQDEVWPSSSDPTECHGVYGTDIGGINADKEVIAGGYATVSGTVKGNIHTFDIVDTTISERDDTYWYDEVGTQAWGVYASDVDRDSTVEVLSVGQMTDNNGVLWADLRIWHK